MGAIREPTACCSDDAQDPKAVVEVHATLDTAVEPHGSVRVAHCCVSPVTLLSNHSPRTHGHVSALMTKLGHQTNRDAFATCHVYMVTTLLKPQPVLFAK